MAETNTLSEELKGKFTVDIPKGQSLRRDLPGIGIVDFSKMTLAQAESLMKRGCKVLRRVEDSPAANSKSKPNQTDKK